LSALLLLVPIVPPLLAAGVPRADNGACGGVPRHPSDNGAGCRTLRPIRRTVAAALLLCLLRLLGRCLLLGLGLLLGLCRWCLRCYGPGERHDYRHDLC
jgi:hypothetical protein